MARMNLGIIEAEKLGNFAKEEVFTPFSHFMQRTSIRMMNLFEKSIKRYFNFSVSNHWNVNLLTYYIFSSFNLNAFLYFS